MSFFTGFVTGLANSVSDQIDQKEEDKRTRAQMRLKYMLENDSKLQEREAESAKLMKTAQSVAKEYGDPRLAAVVYEKLDAGYDIKSAKDFLDSNKITFNDSKPNPVGKVDEQMEASGLTGAKPAPTMPMNPDMDPAMQPVQSVQPSAVPSAPPAKAEPASAPEQKKPSLFSGIFGGGKSDEDMAAEDFRTITGRDYAEGPKTGGMEGVDYRVERKSGSIFDEAAGSEHKMRIALAKAQASGDPQQIAEAQALWEEYQRYGSEKDDDPTGAITDGARNRLNKPWQEIADKVNAFETAHHLAGQMKEISARNPAALTTAGGAAALAGRLQNEIKAYSGLFGDKFETFAQIPLNVIKSELDKDPTLSEDYKQLALIRHALATEIARAAGNTGAAQSNADYERAYLQTGTASDPVALAKQLDQLMEGYRVGIERQVDNFVRNPDFYRIQKKYGPEAADQEYSISGWKDLLNQYKSKASAEQEAVDPGQPAPPAERQPAPAQPAPAEQPAAAPDKITLDMNDPDDADLIKRFPKLKDYIGTPLTPDELRAIVKGQ